MIPFYPQTELKIILDIITFIKDKSIYCIYQYFFGIKLAWDCCIGLKMKKKINKNDEELSLDEQSELIVKVFQVSLDTLVSSGLEENDALNGLLSQIAVLVDPSALEHAITINQKFRSSYLNE